MFFRKERNLHNKPSGSELGFPGPIKVTQWFQMFYKALVYLKGLCLFTMVKLHKIMRTLSFFDLG